ncbi:hypothetical protein GGTG_13280 [Gaeumannomyces tritici R3-111a-1]|uniref:Uncharacterized protein n=1 Tax=Gaeumannomyces tritici (strain R3-111a-1) TaxID=644352 RepID=J3PIF2_GAET3|nr:hypothetical protein GGTG_13280 [Gaeumannomyces tritici R3-111a-1]EJT69171.1 hypothetical protein GGTG_13280 [Gaeumannomyces tritici R3-111a-1]
MFSQHDFGSSHTKNRLESYVTAETTAAAVLKAPTAADLRPLKLLVRDLHLAQLERWTRRGVCGETRRRAEALYREIRETETRPGTMRVVVVRFPSFPSTNSKNYHQQYNFSGAFNMAHVVRAALRRPLVAYLKASSVPRSSSS